MDMVSDKTIVREAAVGTVEHLYQRSIGIAIIRDNEWIDLGSGTGVRIGSRTFVATAAHVIEPYDDDEIWLIRSEEPSSEPTPIVASSLVGGGTHDLLDLAYLELDIEPKDIGKVLIGIDELMTGICHLPGGLVILNGYPHANIDPEKAKQKELSAQSMSYHVRSIDPEEWPDEVISWPHYARRDVNILADYPSEGNVLVDGKPFVLPDPEGMSGGGIWTLYFPEGAVWSPTQSRLVGIITEWDPSGRWVMGNQIQHWLQLVADDYPDIAEHILPYIND